MLGVARYGGRGGNFVAVALSLRSSRRIEQANAAIHSLSATSGDMDLRHRRTAQDASDRTL